MIGAVSGSFSQMVIFGLKCEEQRCNMPSEVTLHKAKQNKNAVV
jgi:hypothetical protein